LSLDLSSQPFSVADFRLVDNAGILESPAMTMAMKFSGRLDERRVLAPRIQPFLQKRAHRLGHVGSRVNLVLAPHRRRLLLGWPADFSFGTQEI
jgi:hypothetical protein